MLFSKIIENVFVQNITFWTSEHICDPYFFLFFWGLLLFWLFLKNKFKTLKWFKQSERDREKLALFVCLFVCRYPSVVWVDFGGQWTGMRGIAAQMVDVFITSHRLSWKICNCFFPEKRVRQSVSRSCEHPRDGSYHFLSVIEEGNFCNWTTYLLEFSSQNHFHLPEFNYFLNWKLIWVHDYLLLSFSL